MEERKDEMVMGGFQNALSIYVVEGGINGALVPPHVVNENKGKENICPNFSSGSIHNVKRITFCFRTSILPNDDKRKKESLVHTKGMWFACLYKPPIVMSPVDVWFVKANMNPSFFSHSFGLSTVSRRKGDLKFSFRHLSLVGHDSILSHFLPS